ncbi:restriction endonuclease subunit S [Campylobacter sp. MG1]|uniref:restriction endonuclease subunit S n=1 Tax=Campylobacter sp. MG1 TaxID=2976332 RepID=UPI00226D3612|nr:restriction endonuclease subunit S [Campylobacter sp. MG1]
MSIRWEEVRLGDICSIQMCKRIFKDETTQEGEIPFYKIGTIGDKADAYISKELFLEYKNKFNYPKKGEVLITCSGTVGKCIVFDGHDSYYQDSNIVWLRLKDNIMDNSFLYYFLSNHKWDNLGQTTIKRIYSDDLKNITIKLPPLKEQEKIAEILSSCDEHIKNLKNLKSELEKEKLHLMNELLSGKTRFANFTTPWQEVAIKDIFQEYTKLNSDNYDQYTIGKNGIKPFEDKRHSITNHKTFKKNDLIIGIGIDEVNININIENGCCSPIYHIYNLNEEKLNPIFGYFAIKTLIQPIKGKIIKTSTRRQFEFTHSEFLKYFLILPSLEEQKKIGEVLSACDEHLECLNELITAQTTLKSHLLTELLTGNIRVQND